MLNRRVFSRNGYVKVSRCDYTGRYELSFVGETRFFCDQKLNIFIAEEDILLQSDTEGCFSVKHEHKGYIYIDITDLLEFYKINCGFYEIKTWDGVNEIKILGLLKLGLRRWDKQRNPL